MSVCELLFCFHFLGLTYFIMEVFVIIFNCNSSLFLTFADMTFSKQDNKGEEGSQVKVAMGGKK